MPVGAASDGVIEQLFEVVALGRENGPARREVGNGHGGAEKSPTGCRAHQVEEMTTMLVPPPHGVHNVGGAHATGKRLEGLHQRAGTRQDWAPWKSSHTSVGVCTRRARTSPQ